MNPRIDQLVKTLLQKDTLEQCSLPELRQFAERHPYFGAAQLLLAKKMQQEHTDDFDKQLQKTLLYFHNPLWVEQLLNDTGQGEVIKSRKEEPVAVMESAPEPVTASPEPAFIPVEPAPVESVMVVAEASAAPGPLLPASPGPQPETEPVLATIPEPEPEPVVQQDTLLFEPYHTVDYFASQGIKFREEEKPKDKFGQQLKSFTEWLKTLKKVPVSEIVKAEEPVAEKNVVEMAERSVADREILTEAMAEVWEKQGNRARAIEIYGKLSLLEPAKSTYFAAKIEDLKKQN